MSFSPCNRRPPLSRKGSPDWGAGREKGEGKHKINGMRATPEITWEENIRTFFR